MNNNPNQPRDYDAVLGGQTPPPVQGVVLGGIEGVKRRLASPTVEARIAALSEALNYGEAGLDLVIKTLQDSSEQVQRSAASLLRKKGGFKAKQALLEYNPWLFFTTLANWNTEEFNPDVGIAEPVGKAYLVNFNCLELLLQDPQIHQVEALICRDLYDDLQFYDFVNAISGACKQLSNLKALFIGDGEEDEYMRCCLKLGDISAILKAYPQLEVLQARGNWGLEVKPLQHECLKTLIVETGFMAVRSQSISEICALDLPALEYLELWLGGCVMYGEDIITKDLIPILSGELFPNLKYLGLRSSDYSDNIALCIAESPTIVDRLAVLDLSMGTLTDEGAEALLNCPAINRLHTLNVNRNCLNINMIQRLSELDCRVIADSQDDGGVSRYWALYE